MFGITKNTNQSHGEIAIFSMERHSRTSRQAALNKDLLVAALGSIVLLPGPKDSIHQQ